MDEYRQFMEKYQTQVSNLNKMVESQPLGIYLLQMQNLTQVLMPKAEVLLENLRKILAELVSSFLCLKFCSYEYLNPINQPFRVPRSLFVT